MMLKISQWRKVRTWHPILLGKISFVPQIVSHGIKIADTVSNLILLPFREVGAASIGNGIICHTFAVRMRHRIAVAFWHDLFPFLNAS